MIKLLKKEGERNVMEIIDLFKGYEFEGIRVDFLSGNR